MPLGQHIRVHLEDNRAILQSNEQRRIFARVVLEQGRADNLVVFGLPDTHFHADALCDQRAAGQFVQRVGSSLKQRLGLSVSFVSYTHRPIRDQRHLESSVRYILQQHLRHGLDLRTFFEATSLPDLLGLRLIGDYTIENLRRCLPRTRLKHILQWAELPEIIPAMGPLNALRDAALAAAALSDLGGRSEPVIECRRAMLEVIGARMSTAETASLLGVGERSVQRLRHRRANHALVRAIQLQLGLRQTFGSPASNESEEPPAPLHSAGDAWHSC